MIYLDLMIYIGYSTKKIHIKKLQIHYVKEVYMMKQYGHIV